MQLPSTVAYVPLSLGVAVFQYSLVLVCLDSGFATDVERMEPN